MRYLALGDSISIDDYTGVRGGGAASQFARHAAARGDAFINLTRDGQITYGVLRDVAKVFAPPPELITLTIGGNDFLEGSETGAVLNNIRAIAGALRPLKARVIMNTVYDPTDGNDLLAAELGVTPEKRADFRALNAGIIEIAREHKYLLCDLEALFRGHGIASEDAWIVLGIEPNLAGATAIANAWAELARLTKSS